METSELFLLAWATIATILAVVFKHLASRAMRNQAILELSILALANKQAELYIDGNTVKVRGI
jgi:hypothetical protein